MRATRTRACTTLLAAFAAAITAALLLTVTTAEAHDRFSCPDDREVYQVVIREGKDVIGRYKSCRLKTDRTSLAADSTHTRVTDRGSVASNEGPVELESDFKSGITLSETSEVTLDGTEVTVRVEGARPPPGVSVTYRWKLVGSNKALNTGSSSHTFTKTAEPQSYIVWLTFRKVGYTPAYVHRRGTIEAIS